MNKLEFNRQLRNKTKREAQEALKLKRWVADHRWTEEKAAARARRLIRTLPRPDLWSVETKPVDALFGPAWALSYKFDIDQYWYCARWVISAYPDVPQCVEISESNKHSNPKYLLGVAGSYSQFSVATDDPAQGLVDLLNGYLEKLCRRYDNDVMNLQKVTYEYLGAGRILDAMGTLLVSGKIKRMRKALEAAQTASRNLEQLRQVFSWR